MAIGGRRQQEFVNVNYKGVGTVGVVAVQPNMKQLNDLGFSNVTEEPVYISEVKDQKTNETVKQVRIDVFYKIDPERNNGIEGIKKKSFFIKDKKDITNDGTKVKVINIYGENIYLTLDDAKNKTIPENLGWFEGNTMRPAYDGELEFNDFLKVYLDVPNRVNVNKKTGVKIEIKDKTQAHCRLEIERLFKGDFTEIRQIPNLFPTNRVKVLFSIKKSDDNKVYQSFLPYVMRHNTTNYDYVKAQVDKDLGFGKYANQIISFEPLHEYKEDVQPTSFSPTNSNDMFESSNPFATPSFDDLPY